VGKYVLAPLLWHERIKKVQRCTGSDRDGACTIATDGRRLEPKVFKERHSLPLRYLRLKEEKGKPPSTLLSQRQP